jgi:putative oxidoreductase
MGLLSTQIKDNAIHFALLLIRLSAGILMMPHGYAKLMHYAERKDKFMNFMGLGSTISLALVIFAEFFCSALLAAGLFTRLVLVALIITALVIVFKAHGCEIFGDAETGFLYLISYVVIFIKGPGKYSADKLLLKK